MKPMMLIMNDASILLLITFILMHNKCSYPSTQCAAVRM